MTTKIPQPPGIPLLGNIFDVDPNNTWVSLKKLADKYGEIFKITALGHQIVFIANSQLCEELCDETRFRKCVAGPVVEIRHSVHDALFSAFNDEPSWGIAHRIIAPVLSTSFVPNYFDDTRQCVDELIRKWKVSSGADQKITPIDELNRLSLEATILSFHGKKLNCLTGPEHPMIQAMEGVTSESMKRPNRPALFNRFVYGGKFERDTNTMRSFGVEIYHHRKDNPAPDRKDMLNALMNVKDPETGQGLTDEQIVDEIITMIIGVSTAPCLIATAMYYLCKNPSAITKAREEIDRVLGTDPITHEKISELTYCEAIIKESLRLSTPAPGFNIEPLPETKGPILLANGKYEIPPGQMMIIVLASVNRDPAVFNDPLAFEPERMMPDKFAKYPSGVKKWYGNGKRECTGKHYAWLWNLVTLATILRGVDFEMADPGYELKQDGWFNIRPADFHVKVKART